MGSDEAAMSKTGLAYGVAGRAMAAYLQGCRITALAATADRPPWQRVSYEPPRARKVRMSVGEEDGSLRPTTAKEQSADALRQAQRLEAITCAAGPVAVALQAGGTADYASLTALEEEWFGRLALELDPAASRERI